MFSRSDFMIVSRSSTQYSVVQRIAPEILLETFASYPLAESAIAQALESGAPVEYLLGLLSVVPLHSGRSGTRRKARHHAR